MLCILPIMKRIFCLALLVLCLLLPVFANEKTELTVSVKVKPVHSLWERIANHSLKEKDFAIQADYRYFLLDAKAEVELKNLELHPIVSLNLVAPINNFRAAIGTGYDFKDEKFVRQFALDYKLKNFVFGAEVDANTMFKFDNKNWADFNDLEKNLSNAKISAFVGYRFKTDSETYQNTKLFKADKLAWNINAFTSFLYTGLGMNFQADKLSLGFDISLPIPNLYLAYNKTQKYPYQAVRAMAFTTFRFDLAGSYRLLNTKHFSTDLGMHLTSLFFTGKEVNQMAKFQAYSVGAFAKETYWFTKNNGIFVQTGLPILTIYLQNQDRTVLNSLLSDVENAKLCIKYMTRIGYVHTF